MELLFEQSHRLIEATSLEFKRFLFEKINWKSRLIGIKGARGTGKTTLALQYLKLQGVANTKTLYISLDDLYFSTHTLKDTITAFYKQGGKIIVMDEVHKYKSWAQEIKNAYDFFPDIQLIFTGSSIIDIAKQEGDLSRRAVMYELPGMSFREYLLAKKILDVAPISLDTILKEPLSVNQLFPTAFRPYTYFGEYLQTGYYPFALEDTSVLHQQINQLVRTIIEVDMAEVEQFDLRNAKKILQLVAIIAQQVPFKPNISSLAEKTSIHRNSINNYLYFLEKAKLISLLHAAGNSIATLQKPEKIYLDNTTLLAAIGNSANEIGTVRETFFYSQLKVNHAVTYSGIGDFMIDQHFTFEVGGMSKKQQQIEGISNAWVVKDQLETYAYQSLPLWWFGMLY